MTRRLSSFIVPISKIVPWVVVPLGVIVWFQNLDNSDPKMILYLLAWGVIWHWITRRWMNVTLRGYVLVVSRDFRTFYVPLAGIARIKATSWWAGHPRRVIITLRRRMEFGDKIVFVPSFLSGSASGIVTGLEALVKRVGSFSSPYESRAPRKPRRDQLPDRRAR